VCHTVFETLINNVKLTSYWSNVKISRKQISHWMNKYMNKLKTISLCYIFSIASYSISELMSTLFFILVVRILKQENQFQWTCQIPN
jgi:hypothetical protein